MISVEIFFFLKKNIKVWQDNFEPNQFNLHAYLSILSVVSMLNMAIYKPWSEKRHLIVICTVYTLVHLIESHLIGPKD